MPPLATVTAHTASARRIERAIPVCRVIDNSRIETLNV
jgi:hypothetical protein